MSAEKIKNSYKFASPAVLPDDVHIIYSGGGAATNKDRGNGENGVMEDAAAAEIILLIFLAGVDIYSSDFNTTSFNWWMETTAVGGRATPEYGNATRFIWWLFT